MPNLLVRGRHDLVRGTNEATDEPLPLIPPPRTAAGAEYHFASRSPGDAFLGAEVVSVKRQSRANEMDFVTPGYTLLNLDAGFNYRMFGRTARVDIGVRNALDRRYRSFLSRYKESALEAGRNVVVIVSTAP